MNKFKKILNEIHSSLRFFENKDSEKHPYYLKKIRIIELIFNRILKFLYF